MADAPLTQCPKCGAPCTTKVEMRGGDHGWGTTDTERTTYRYAQAQPPAAPLTPQVLKFSDYKAPEGWAVVLVPEDVPGDEPDWEECQRQAEVATGLRVGDPTMPIIIREVRRWIAQKQWAAVRPLTDEQIVMDGLMMVPNNVCVDMPAVFEAGVRFAERWHGITAPSTPTPPEVAP